VAQVPTNVVSGTNVVVVHSLDTAQASSPVMVTVKPASTKSGSDPGTTDPGAGSTPTDPAAGNTDPGTAPQL
jgi:hypothetical protein